MHSSVQHLRCADEAEVPAIYYPLFFGITGAVQGLNLRQVMERARRQFLALQMRNWAFWLPAQYFQFVFLPIEKQVLFTCIAGLVWNIILSASAGSARSGDDDGTDDGTDDGRSGRVVPAKGKWAGGGRGGPTEKSARDASLLKTEG